ncbi:hypothetical protein MAF45_08740 [Mesosutterella sp. OilRF-GAM-744-9]|uniref:Transposase IS116/IS110/IS902 family protein n=1 Tax=Mesosutterella porci TaxID=2915351 RepID=A0ABS9MSC4_9BURK|nr:hypothetical protein [Mesosutterella sp. oilRF-744-WT-GAM-9]MCG5031527.1 hypothetical protein [Mesosutterella sp. oilRF-744-WT-GAM-9]
MFIEEHPDELSPLTREAILELRDSWLRALERERQAGQKYDRLVKENDDAKRLMTIPGIGVKSAGALLAHGGEASRFATAGSSPPRSGWCPGYYALC